MGVARPAPRFELLTRAGCHLCDEMQRVLEVELPARGLDFVKVDVDNDAALAATYGEVVPVLLRDGRPVAKVRLDRRRLVRLINRRR